MIHDHQPHQPDTGQSNPLEQQDASLGAGRTPSPQASVESLPLLADHFSITRKISDTVLRGDAVFVIFTDIDGTLTPAVGSRNEQVDAIQKQEMAAFSEVIHSNDYILIPITGSSYETGTSTLPNLSTRITEGEIPHIFDGLIVEGGTKAVIKVPGLPEFTYDSAYAEYVGQQIAAFHDNLSDSFQRAESLIAAIRAPNSDGPFAALSTPPTESQALIKDITGRSWSDTLRVEYQPHAHPEPGTAPLDKISLYIYASDLAERDAIENAFITAYPDLNVICCEERDFNSAAQQKLGAEPPVKRYCMDITPINKATPIELFSKAIREATEQQNALLGGNSPVVTAYFGDAGNDLPAARSPYINFMGIPGDSSPEIKRAYPELAESKDAVYLETADQVGVASMLAALEKWGMTNRR